jgi:hypothetical protein
MSSETEQYIKSMTIETAGQVRLFRKSPQLVIEQFAVAFLRYICSPDIVDLQRLMISEAGRSGIGELYYANAKTAFKCFGAFHRFNESKYFKKR